MCVCATKFISKSIDAKSNLKQKKTKANSMIACKLYLWFDGDGNKIIRTHKPKRINLEISNYQAKGWLFPNDRIEPSYSRQISLI